jgi:uncharacterized RDD family membrane protein YckC
MVSLGRDRTRGYLCRRLLENSGELPTKPDTHAAMCARLFTSYYGSTKHGSCNRRTELSPSSPNVGEHLSQADTEVVPAWKQELNERLAATRSRRLRVQGEHIQGQQVPLPGLEHLERKVESRASRLAAKVAQRYANAPSYSEVLTAKARSEAETPTPALGAGDVAELLPEPSPENWTGSLDAELISGKPGLGAAVDADHVTPPFLPAGEAEEAVEPLAVNLIDFPRELVAARKVRPRLAEGPLRESSQPTGHDQLKIFEVAPESISQTVRIGAAGGEWSPIRLDTNRVSEISGEGQSPIQENPLKAAPLEDRLMAGIFDLALVIAAFALFVLVFVACTAHPPSGKPALLAAGLVLGGFFLLYQYLFFKYADGTPGMRYAKIALCTFEDENPTRQAMCRRVFFLLLSAAPLGLGFAWAWFDPDRLGWHDRLSRIYQRSYS